MSRRVRCVASIATTMALVVLACAPLAAANPPPSTGGRSAESTIDDLTAEGFNVQINWVTGFDTKPLSECWVSRVNNPGGTPPSDGTFTTVYVDVACPNGDDGGFGFGVGVG